MDRLRSPGGCPWDAEQTHESLTRYLLEETYEVLEAIETHDAVLLREELGDLLLQVLFHARLAQEADPARRFDIDDVADDLVAKLVRRHPHVFGDAPRVTDTATLNEAWELGKAIEKGRRSATDGVPVAQPALALAAKLLSRAARAGLDLPTPTSDGGGSGVTSRAANDVGARLFDVVRDAAAQGVDPEAALRRTARAYRALVQKAEDGSTAGNAPAAGDTGGPDR